MYTYRKRGLSDRGKKGARAKWKLRVRREGIDVSAPAAFGFPSECVVHDVGVSVRSPARRKESCFWQNNHTRRREKSLAFGSHRVLGVGVR